VTLILLFILFAVLSKKLFEWSIVSNFIF
jgi:hypothetical protein